MAQHEHDENARPRDPRPRWASAGAAAAALVMARNAPAMARAAAPMRFDVAPIPHLRGHRRLGAGATFRGLAGLLGAPRAPALVVGRTLVVGALTREP